MSAILSADDLNDFIKPGVACIKPVESVVSKEEAEIAIGVDGRPEEGGRALPEAQISLQDCLACSGCITSSEAALVELQSPKELLSRLEAAPDSVFVLSVSPQARASLANAFQCSIQLVDLKLRALFINKLKFRCVVGTQVGRVLSLVESYKEAKEHDKLPVLNSVCPGWTLYTEKTHSELVPHLSAVKSPQQITGHLIKHLFSEELSICPKNVYHVSLMPCFDKKLESARPAFAYDDAREVDLVITPKELIDMLQTHLATTFNEIAPQTDNYLQSPVQLTPNTASIVPKQAGLEVINKVPKLWPKNDDFSNEGSSSGGYLAYILNEVLKNTEGGRIEKIEVKSRDFIEYQVLDASNAAVFKGAQVYGFKNIQNMIRKLKMKKGKAAVTRRVAKRPSTQQASDPSSYNYIEVMACPGGCAGGGGQIAAPSTVLPKVWVSETDAKYYEIEQQPVNGDLAAQLMHEMGLDSNEPFYTGLRTNMMRTTYAFVEPEQEVSALSVGTQW